MSGSVSRAFSTSAPNLLWSPMVSFPVISSMTRFPTITWAVKLFVAATPTSGPQFRSRTWSLCLASDEPATLTIETTDPTLFLLAFLTASSTSAVSPLWLSATNAVSSSMKGSSLSNSPEIIVSHFIFASSASLLLMTSAAW